MESLNYTDLATAVFVLSITTLLLFFLLIAVIADHVTKTKELRHDFMKEDEAIYGHIEDVRIKFVKDTSEFSTKMSTQYRELADNFAKLKNELIQPKYDNGDKIVCADGTKGIIQKTERENSHFYYTIKTRKYFNHPAGEKRVSEFEILGRA